MSKKIKRNSNLTINEGSQSSDKLPRRKINPRKLRRGSLSVILTVSFIATVVLLNVIVGIISKHVNITADLSAESIYSLDEQTEQYVNTSLTSDVAVTVLSSEKNFEADKNNKQVSEILKQMARMNSHIKLEYLDLNQSPNYTSRFTGETLSENYIVVESGQTERHKIITPQDYFGITTEDEAAYYYYYGIVGGYYIEQEVVSAMMYVTNDELVRIAFTTGFGESDSTALQNLLSKNGYDVESVNLTTTEQISDEVDFVVIFAPTIDIDAVHLAKLDKFLENEEKNVFYFASTIQPETPNIESFLNDWGLSVGYSAIGQHDEQYLMSSVTLYAHLQEICNTEYTSTAFGKSLYMLGADMRPVSILERSGISTVPLVTTYDGAFLFPLDLEDSESFDSDNAESGTFNDIALSSKDTSKVCAIGSDRFASSILMSYSNSVNADFFVGLFNSISGKEDSIVINPKEYSNITFEMNAATANTLGIILCIVLPVSVIVLGIVVWVYRRHK